MKDAPDILAKYRRPGRRTVNPPAPETASAGFRQPYEPYRLSKEAKRHLEIRLPFPDPAECPLNAMITNLQGEWRMGLGITLIYGTTGGNTLVVDIAGENLQTLFRAVQDWKAEWIEAFDPQFHIAPTDPKAPMIRSITMHTQRAETPPPPQKRH